jgi:hypothetical protein
LRPLLVQVLALQIQLGLQTNQQYLSFRRATHPSLREYAHLMVRLKIPLQKLQRDVNELRVSCDDLLRGQLRRFPQYDLLIKEKKGRFVLFNEKLLHEVKPYDYKKERVTIAFNFYEIKDWGNNSNYYWINKDDKEIIL